MKHHYADCTAYTADVGTALAQRSAVIEYSVTASWRNCVNALSSTRVFVVSGNEVALEALF